MVVSKLKLMFFLITLSLHLSAILCQQDEHKSINGISMTLHMKRKSKSTLKEISMEEPLYYASDLIEYYIKLSVGTPAQELFLVMDTGSDVVWAPCTRKYTCYRRCPHEYITVFLPRKSSSAVPVKCADPMCKDLHRSIQNCSRACPKYSLTYGTGNATGRLLSETLTLPLEERPKIKHFGLGCSVGSSVFAGMAGFGRGGLSMPSQLSPLLGDRFAYCLNDQNNSSVIVIGDKAVPKYTALTYTPFVINSSVPDTSSHYYIGLEAVSIGGKRLKLPFNVLAFDSQGNGGTVIDSGASYSLFPEAIYSHIVGEFASQIGRDTRARDLESRTGWGLCYNFSGVTSIQLPEFAFHFKGGSDMILPLYNSFMRVTSDSLCLAMLNTSRLEIPVGPAVLLGSYQQFNFYILYDRGNNRLGFTQKACKTLG